jgi:hypothetical protein
MQGELNGLKTQAQADGLDTIAQAWSQSVQGPSSFQRYMHPSVPRGGMVRGLGTDQSLVDQMVDRSIELGITPLADTDRTERVLVLPSDRHMAILVAELDRRVPMREAQFDNYLDQGALTGRITANDFGGQDLGDLAASFTGDALRDRNNFVRNTPQDDEDDAEADQPTTASAAK